MENSMRLFTWPIAGSFFVLACGFILGGAGVLGTLVVLGILEICLSADNAVVNSVYLQRMSPKWQTFFLTVGILIAVFGMRLLFPLLIVAISAGISPISAFDLALNHPHVYSQVLMKSHSDLATFGAIFLELIFLNFVTQKNEVRWLAPVENLMTRFGAIDYFPVLAALCTLTIFARDALLAGILAILTYLAIDLISKIIEKDAANVASVGIGAFLYLELMDASFSFDGLLASFAITSNIILIMAGLGIGALYVRSLTVFFVRKGILKQFVYLEHGAFYVIGALSCLLLISLYYDVPEVVSAGITVAILGSALASSVLSAK
jgi:hypothetical protein